MQNKFLCTQLSCVFHPGEIYEQGSKQPPVCQSKCDDRFFQRDYTQDSGVASMSLHHKICRCVGICKSVTSFSLSVISLMLTSNLRIVRIAEVSDV